MQELQWSFTNLQISQNHLDDLLMIQECQNGSQAGNISVKAVLLDPLLLIFVKL